MTDRTEADTIRDIAQQAAGGGMLPNTVDVAVLPGGGGSTFTVDLEPYHLHPRRPKGARIVYDAGSFATYLHRHETAATEVYADVQTAKVIGILDSHQAALVNDGDAEGLPGWQDHRITLQLTKSPSWIAWENNDGKMLPQAEFAEFAEENAVDVRDPSPAELLDLAQSLEMTKTVAFESGTRLRDGQTKLVYKEEVGAHAGARGDLDIPQSLTLALKPYIGGPTYAVPARFRYRLKGQALVIGYVLERPDIIRDLAFDDVVADLRNGRAATENRPAIDAIKAPVFMGKP